MTTMYNMDQQSVKTQKFKDFENSGLFGAPWPIGICHAVVPICVFGETICQTNRPEAHAEPLVLDTIRSFMTKGRRLNYGNIKIYLSYSPCGGCADEIIQFHEECAKRWPSTTIEIVFSALYNTERLSFQTRGYTPTLDENEKQKNEHGFRKLHALRYNGLVIRPMTAADWQLLIMELNVTVDYDVAQYRINEDQFMQWDFEYILNKPEVHW